MSDKKNGLGKCHDAKLAQCQDELHRLQGDSEPHESREECLSCKRLATIDGYPWCDQCLLETQLAAESGQAGAMQQEAVRVGALLEKTSIELTAACAARDALTRECNELEDDCKYYGTLVRKRGRELTQTRTELMRLRKLWHDLAEVAQMRTELAQLRKRLTATVQRCGYCDYEATGADAFNLVTEHIKSCPGHPLARALAELAQARRELGCLEGAAREYERQLAAAQEAAEWLWGYWDGNTLVAKPGYEDDIRAAWGDLLVAVDSAHPVTMPLKQQIAELEAGRDYWRKRCKDDTATLDAAEATSDCLRKASQMEREIAGHLMVDDPQPQIMQEWHEACKCTDGLIGQACLRDCAKCAAAEAALADCGSRGIYIDFDGPADAIMQMAARIEKLEDESMIEVEITGREMVEALQAERRLRRVTERCHKAALALARSRGERLEKAGQRAERAEALAHLVNEEAATLLEQLGKAWQSKFNDKEAARNLAAQIREALDDT